MIWLRTILAMGRANRRPPESDLSVRVTRNEIEAEWRWSRSNEEGRQRDCKCGRPATTARAYSGTVGTVPYLSWTCDEHQGADGWTSDGEIMVAIYNHPSPCPEGLVTMETGPIGGPSTMFGCPHRTHESNEAPEAAHRGQ